MFEMLKKNGGGSLRSLRQHSKKKQKKRVSFCNCYHEQRDEESGALSRSSSTDSLCSHHATTHLVDNFKRTLSQEEHAAYWYSDHELKAINKEREEETLMNMLKQRAQLRSKNAFQVIDMLSMQYLNDQGSGEHKTFPKNNRNMSKLERLTHENTMRNKRRTGTGQYHFLSRSSSSASSSPSRSTLSLQYYLNCCKGGGSAHLHTKDNGMVYKRHVVM
jgi:hypothetical protein